MAVDGVARESKRVTLGEAGGVSPRNAGGCCDWRARPLPWPVHTDVLPTLVKCSANARAQFTSREGSSTGGLTHGPESPCRASAKGRQLCIEEFCRPIPQLARVQRIGVRGSTLWVRRWTMALPRLPVVWRTPSALRQ